MNIKADIIYSWNQNNKVTLYLLDNIEEDWLLTKLNDKGRSIGEQFVHINNIRSFWIGKVDEKIDLKIDKKYANSKQKLIEALQKSSQKMSDTLYALFEQESIKGYKPHPTAFFTQMIAHESHHRGQIMAIIARNDLRISKSVNFGLWSWNNK
ncbi:DinB family protein [Flavivirga aquimarina]|uniref:DinB family protein n=1 Tax=Flavivirga aquimarina TaxID=2027862 RepID=A0ABT8W9G4_9FLAO|nr:DinB family protein [Flavivirga aquimarina]MDO5969771.1 DinB family protein [Flavivirga aquimarina]